LGNLAVHQVCVQPHSHERAVSAVPVLRAPRQVLCVQHDAVWVSAQSASFYRSVVVRDEVHSHPLGWTTS
jgi:hypothetical protein